MEDTKRQVLSIHRASDKAVLLAAQIRTRSSYNRIGELLRVGVLLKVPDSSFPHAPNVCELCPHLSSRRLVNSAVGAEHHNAIPGIKKLFRGHRVSLPFSPQSRKHSLLHRLRGPM